jgi:hypothetical protein
LNLEKSLTPNQLNSPNYHIVMEDKPNLKWENVMVVGKMYNVKYRYNGEEFEDKGRGKEKGGGMRIYKVCKVRRPGREHDGFEYFSNKKAADKKQTENEREYLDLMDDDEEPISYDKDTVEEYEIQLTKIGVLDFLNRHASYPNNG